MSESELIIAFNSGDKTAFTVIYQRLYPDIYSFAKRFIPEEDAVDITADVFIKLFNSTEQFAAIQNIKAWLIVVVRTSCMNFLKKEKHKVTAHAELRFRLLHERPNWQEDLERIEVKRIYLNLINEAISMLSEQKQTIYRLMFKEGFKNGEIASLLNIDERKIRDIKYRMIVYLREVLTEKGVAVLISLATCWWTLKA